MRYLALVTFLILMNAVPAQAQILSDRPLCITLSNKTGNEVTGHVETAQYIDPMGRQSWHRQNFRLAEDAEQEVCSTGPFFDSYKLRVVVKTLIPLYSCLVTMNRTVTISRREDDYGFLTLVMDCPAEAP